MRLYPDVPSRRAAALLRDVLTVALVVLLALVALEVRETVNGLAVLGTGVREVGERVPFVGGRVEELGRAGEDRVHRLADTLALLIFGLPALLLLGRWLPERIREVRALTAAAIVLADPEDEQRRRLIATRAAFSLPYGRLVAYTRDPLGDLAAERYDALVAAALDDVGLQTTPPPARRRGITGSRR